MTLKTILKRTLQTATLSVFCLSLPQFANATTTDADQNSTPAASETAAPAKKHRGHGHGHHHKGGAAKKQALSPAETAAKLEKCKALLAAEPAGKDKKAKKERARCEKFVKEHEAAATTAEAAH